MKNSPVASKEMLLALLGKYSTYLDKVGMNKSDTLMTKENREFLERHGVTMDEFKRQWSLLTEEPKRIVLGRPCTFDDGIEVVPKSEWLGLSAAHHEAANQGRWTKFVPASGAASRMFAFTSFEEKKRFCNALDRFPFARHLKKLLGERGIELEGLLRDERYDEVIQAVVSPKGLDYGRTPKALLHFHTYDGKARTAFEEHLSETLAAFGANHGEIRAHFTVSSNHQDDFRAQLAQFKREIEKGECHVGFSVQHASTDTISRYENGEIVRHASGDPVLRPGGHGALIENLNSIQGDLIFVKNIDNVAHRHSQVASIAWMQILGGYLVRLENSLHHHVRALKSGKKNATSEAFDFLQATFPNSLELKREDPDEQRRALISRLSRPLRVCGMVKNEGEPGGGPFWVRETNRSESVQIVEAAEINQSDPAQVSIFSHATHFNPVFMALSVRDERGAPFDLRNFVDQDRVIRAKKQIAGKTAITLERPGLWNGGMAGWNSLFVEVPVEVFSPVKSALDLLRPAHQPASGNVAG